MILTSTWERGFTQLDGTFLITERHTAEDGEVFQFIYSATEEIDPDLVMASRVEMLNAQIAARAAALAIAYGTTLPITVYEFMKRFTAEERIAIRAAAKTDSVVDDFIELLLNSRSVYQSNADIQAALTYLVAQNLLTSERAAEIGAT